MKINRYIVAIISVLNALGCFVLWLISIGTILDISIMGSSKVVNVLAVEFEGYSAFEDPIAWS
jgi:hypothetical protein